MRYAWLFIVGWLDYLAGLLLMLHTDDTIHHPTTGDFAGSYICYGFAIVCWLLGVVLTILDKS